MAEKSWPQAISKELRDAIERNFSIQDILLEVGDSGFSPVNTGFEARLWTKMWYLRRRYYI
jgi:hypothetical protein